MFNRYNTINALMTISITGFCLTLLLSLFINFTGIMLPKEWAILFLITAFFISLVLAFLLFYWTSGQFEDVLKSYLATYKIRKFVRFESSKIINLPNGQQVSSRNSIIQKANNSLWTLTVTFKEGRSILRWKLPSNYQSQKFVKDTFSEVIKELGSIDETHSYPNITREKGRWYSTTSSYDSDGKCLDADEEHFPSL